MFCTNCGKEVHDDSVFCSGCGARLTNECEETKTDEQTVPTETNPEIAAQAAYILGNLYTGLKMVDAAEEEYRRAIGADPNRADVHAALGSLLLKQGNPTAAEKELREAIRIDPRNPGAHHDLGVTLYFRGCWHEAEMEALEALRLDPDDTGARTLLEKLSG